MADKRRTRTSKANRAKDASRATNAENAGFGKFVGNIEEFAIFALDLDGRVATWNAGAYRITGYPPAEIVGKPWTRLFTAEDTDRDLPAELMRRAAADGQSEDSSLRLRKGGMQFWAQVILSVVRDTRGAPAGFTAIIRDISGQKEIQQKLREDEARFRSFSQNFPGFNWIADSQGRYQFGNWNFEHELHLPSSQWLGKSPAELFSADVARTIQKSNETVLSTKSPVLLTEKVAIDGTPHYYLVSKFPIQTDSETFIGGVSIEITSRIEAEDELKRVREDLIRQERLISIAQLSSSLAHDLNNTLNAVSLRLKSLDDDPSFPQKSAIERIEHLVVRAAESVARLQTFVRTHREPQLEEINLADVIRSAAASVRSGSRDRAMKVDLSQVSGDLPPVLGLASDLHQVFTNLLTNAHDAMPSGGSVEVTAARSGEYIEVSIADRGSGIPTSSLEKIFEPFFTTKATPGSGLGLSFATSVMARLGGTIGASNRVGGGAVFMLVFPLAKKIVAAKPSQLETRAEHFAPRVLVIDDDHENLDSMQAALEFRGCDVTISSSGAEAVELLRSGRRFDLIICDIGMPDMNGWEVAARIAELGSPSRMFMLSGWANEIPETDPRRKLVADVLAKPIDLERIEGILREV